MMNRYFLTKLAPVPFIGRWARSKLNREHGILFAKVGHLPIPKNDLLAIGSDGRVIPVTDGIGGAIVGRVTKINPDGTGEIELTDPKMIERVRSAGKGPSVSCSFTP